MEAAIEHLVHGLSSPILFVLIAFCLAVLGKSADWLVDEAVTLSSHWGIPKAIVGATVVSLGTTTPEAAVSVFAALQGSPGLALGNAVGSIICDTGLILGLAILINPMRLDPKIVNRQGWIQIGTGILLILGCLPFPHVMSAFTTGGNLPQWMGWFFLVLLGVYIWLSIRWAKGGSEESHTSSGSTFFILIKLLIAVGFVVVASTVLIPAVKEAAVRMHVPEGIIAATLVAFGTSLPELVTVVTAARRGHGELGVGNVIGADILNVLFVAGASAAVTTGGLTAHASFFKLLFPAMLLVLVTFRVGIMASGEKMKRPFGVILLVTYVIATVMSYAV